MIYTTEYHKALRQIIAGEGADAVKAVVPPISDPFIVHEFDEATLADFSDYMRDLTANNISLAILNIDSFGGEVNCLSGMLEIIESFRENGGKVLTYSGSKAMSCGFVLLTAGDKGMRYVGRYSSAMCHEVAHGDFGKLSDLKNSVKETERLNKQLFEILDRNTGHEEGFWNKQTDNAKNADLFLSPEDCLRLGVADYIGTPNIVFSVGFDVKVVPPAPKVAVKKLPVPV